MRITLTARVDLESSWDEHSITRQIVITLEHTNKAPDLPWDQICAGFVGATIQERLHPTEKNEEEA